MLVELLRTKNKLVEEIKALKEEGKIEEAHKNLEALNEINRQIEVESALEESEKKNLVTQGTEVNAEEEVNPNAVFNKQLLGKSLSDAEQTYINAAGTPGQIEHDSERGGYLVPEEQGNQILEFRRQRVALKPYVNVITVTTLSGKFPMGTDQNGLLTNFEELTEIAQSQVLFKQQKWSVKDYGDIIPVSRTLLEDTNVNLISYIGDQFVRKAVNTENKAILDVLATAKKVAAKTYDDITTVLNVNLDPAISQNAVIVTNQTGYDFLDKLKDTTGRELLSNSLTDPMQKVFKGRPVIAIPDELLKGTESKTPFYVGDLKQAVNFYDRKGVEIAISDQAGFTKNAILLRAIERFDVLPYDTDAVRLVELNTTVAPVAGA